MTHSMRKTVVSMRLISCGQVIGLVVSDLRNFWSALMTNSQHRQLMSTPEETVHWPYLSQERKKWQSMWWPRAVLTAVAVKLWS